MSKSESERKAFNPYLEPQNTEKKIDWKNKATVLKIISKDGCALINADSSLKKDSEIVLSAISSHPYALSFADPKFKSDKKFILSALDVCDAWLISEIDNKLKADKDIVLKALSKDPSAIYYADDKFKKDRKLAMELVKRDGSILKYLHDFKSDKEIVKLAVENDFGNFAYKSASQELREDDEIKALVGSKIKKLLKGYIKPRNVEVKAEGKKTAS